MWFRELLAKLKDLEIGIEISLSVLQGIFIMSIYHLCPRATVNVSSSGRPGQILVSVQRKVIEKVFIKAVKPDGKKCESKTFTLRNIDTEKVKTCSQLKTLIKAHLGEDVESASDFDVGYLHNNSVINLMSNADLQEVWHKPINGSEITLWCDGLRKNCRKRKKDEQLDYDEDNEQVIVLQSKKNEECENRVQVLVGNLKKRHGDEEYSPMQ